MTRESLEAKVDKAVPWVTGVALIAALLVTVFSNTPHPLPGIALSSEALFYIERAVAAMVAIVIGVMLVARGLKRELPSQASTSGLGYPDKAAEAVAGSDDVLSKLSARVDKLDADFGTQRDALQVVHTALREVSNELQRLRQDVGTADGKS